MEIIAGSDIFNEEFKKSKRDTLRYFPELIKFAMEYDNSYDIINERKQYFIDEVEKETINQLMFDTDDDDLGVQTPYDLKDEVDSKIKRLNDYFYLMSPFDAVKAFLDTDYSTLMKKADSNYNDIQNSILRLYSYIMSLTGLEFNTYKLYKATIKDLKTQTKVRSDVALLYKPMCSPDLIISGDDLLYKVLLLMRGLSTEAEIISKFEENPRKFICNKLERLASFPGNRSEDNWYANICDRILSNYVYLSLCSKNPQSLLVDDDKYDYIYRKMDSGNVSIDYVKDVISRGPIKFSESELDYIFHHYIDNLLLMSDNYTLEKSNLLSLVK